MGEGNLKCPICGGDLVWGNDFDACDVSDNYEKDDGAVVSNYTCSKCGRYYEIYEPCKEEREGEYRDFWHSDD